MKYSSLLSLAALFSIGAATLQADVTVGGAPMLASKNIVENAVNSKDHTTLVAAVKAAGLVDALTDDGPFTVFAPTNNAFAALPEGTVASLLKEENKDALTKVLTYHVVAGKMDAATVMAAIKEGDGKAVVETLSGDKLTLMMNGTNNVVVMDAKGGTANISTYDVFQSNGVIHVIDAVLMP